MSAGERLMPRDEEAEEATVAACLVEPANIPEIAATVKPSDFWTIKAGNAFGAVLRVWGRGEAVNTITVAHEMAVANELVDAGGQTWLNEIVRALPTAIGAEFYAGIVSRASTYRRMIDHLTLVERRAYAAPEDVAGVLNDAVEGLLRIGGAERKRAESTAETLAGGLYESLEIHMEDPAALSGLSTGWPELDALIDGLQVGQVYTLAAETSVGKSLLAHNLIRNLARHEWPMLLFSTEMSTRAVGRRLVYLEAGLDRQIPRSRGAYTTGERNAVREAADWYSRLPLTVYAGGLSVGALRGEVRRLKARSGLEVVLVDHIDHVGSAAPNRVAELEQMMADLKSLALTEQVSLILVSHLSRAGLLKNSSSKEQDSDVVMFLRPCRVEGGEWIVMTGEELSAARTRGPQQWFRLDITKNRDGLTGFVPLMLSWEQGGRFFSLAHGGGE